MGKKAMRLAAQSSGLSVKDIEAILEDAKDGVLKDENRDKAKKAEIDKQS